MKKNIESMKNIVMTIFILGLIVFGVDKAMHKEHPKDELKNSRADRFQNENGDAVNWSVVHGR